MQVTQQLFASCYSEPRCSVRGSSLNGQQRPGALVQPIQLGRASTSVMGLHARESKRMAKRPESEYSGRWLLDRRRRLLTRLNGWSPAMILLILATAVFAEAGARLVAAQSEDESRPPFDPKDWLVPDVDEIKRGTKAKLPKPIWPAALEAVRTGMAKNFGDMTLKEDRRSHAPHESRILRYRHGSDGLDVTLSCYNTPREAGEALRFCDRNVSVKTFSTRPGEELRLKGVGDEAYRYHPSGSVIMCYSNVFVVIKGHPYDPKAKAARVIANCLKNVAESATPKILDPGVSDAEKTSYAARLVAVYALTVEGVKQINEAGRVTGEARDKWTVQYDKLARQVTIHALSKDDDEFKRLDTNANGQIDDDEFRPKAVTTFRTEPFGSHIEDDELEEAADLLRRIDRRIETLKGEYAGLSHWTESIKTIERNVYDKRYIEPDEQSSGKLLQFNHADCNQRHRLVYHNRDNQERCSVSIRVIAASIGNRYSVVPPHSSYARAWLIVDQLTADEKLRKELVQIIQEETFKEAGPAGIERRAWFAAVALAHMAKTGKFPGMRWDRPHGKWFERDYSFIMRDEERLILLCLPLKPKVGYNPSLPIAVKAARSSN